MGGVAFGGLISSLGGVYKQGLKPGASEASPTGVLERLGPPWGPRRAGWNLAVLSLGPEAAPLMGCDNGGWIWDLGVVWECGTAPILV